MKLLLSARRRLQRRLHPLEWDAGGVLAFDHDAESLVYLANGQIFIYDASGKRTGQIDLPERPVQVLFGGADRRTLFILTHHALYSVTTRVPGEAGPWGK